VTETKVSNLIAAPTKHLLSLAGGVTTIAGVVSLVTSDSLKNWVKTHGYLVFLILVLAITAAFVVIDIILSKKRKQGAEHDRRIVAQFMEKLPPHSQLIVWLKESFISKSVPVKYVDVLDELAHGMKLNVIGLDNAPANQAHGTLLNAIQEFLEYVTFDLFANADHAVLQNSQDWNREDWLAASARINHARDALVKAYDDFVLVCHRSGLD
jgi:hypothetical protein